MASKTNFIYGDCNARKYAKKYTKNYATLLEMVNCWIFKVHLRHIILFVLQLKFFCEVEQSGLKCGVKCQASCFYYKHICCIFHPVSGCCAPQTLVDILIFIIFNYKKLKKRKKTRNLQQNLTKNSFFKFALMT